MLPHAYELPAAVLLVVTGALTCFAGYRLFKFVLAVYGFILGAMIASSVMGTSNAIGMMVAALLGGLAGALILVFAYFVGVAIVGAGLAALVAHLAWSRMAATDPPAAAIVVVSIVGAIVAIVLQRYVIIVGTAFGGGWTLLIGLLGTMAATGRVRGASGSDAWILYPLTPATGQRWVSIAWVTLGILGAAVQFGVTGRRR